MQHIPTGRLFSFNSDYAKVEKHIQLKRFLAEKYHEYKAGEIDACKTGKFFVFEDLFYAREFFNEYRDVIYNVNNFKFVIHKCLVDDFHKTGQFLYIISNNLKKAWKNEVPLEYLYIPKGTQFCKQIVILEEIK